MFKCVFDVFRLFLESLFFLKGAGVAQFENGSQLRSELHAESRYTSNSTSFFKLYRSPLSTNPETAYVSMCLDALDFV